MSQGEPHTIPLTSNIGYQKQSHVIVHFENADPDLGRKGFQPELRQAAETASVAIVGKLKRFRPLLKKDTGASPSIHSQTKVYDWVQKQADHEKSSPLEVIDDRFFLPKQRLPITAIPQSEQDTIVLFSQLLAGGVIRGIHLLATDQHSMYDGVCRYSYDDPTELHYFDATANPLGIQSEPDFKPISRPFVLEYKYNLDSLWDDFDNEEKDERDINLVVSWTMGDRWKERYTITSFLNKDNIHHRPVHGLTHAFYDDHTGEERFHGVILEELIAYLQDPAVAQEYQIDTYQED